MARRGIDRLREASCRSIAGAVLGRAKMRAALDHLARSGCPGGERIDAVLAGTAARIVRAAAAGGRRGRRVRRVPVGGPLPDVADQVVGAVRIGRVRVHRRRARAGMRRLAVIREGAEPVVCEHLPVRSEIVTPGELGAVQSAARGELEFGLGRKVLALPAGVGKRIVDGDVHDGMVLQPGDRAVGTARMAPVGAGDEAPPLAPRRGSSFNPGWSSAPVEKVDRIVRRNEYERSRDQRLRRSVRIVGGLGRSFGERHVARPLDERGELRVRHGRPIHPESADFDVVRGPFFGIVKVRTHAERAAGNPQHVVARARHCSL